jgi:hypothetical protein
MPSWALRRLCKTYDKIEIPAGEVAEWSIASDLKSDEAQASESSNLSLSVKLNWAAVTERSRSHRSHVV